MRRRGRNILANVAAAGSLLVWTAAFSQGQPPPPVVVTQAESRLLSPVVWYPGTVISRNQARLAAEVEGRLEWVAEVGTTVAQGDEVARIDDIRLRQSLIEHQAALARDRAKLKYTEAEVGRLEKLVPRKLATPSDLDQAISNRGVARGELNASAARLDLTREQLDRTVVRAPFPGIVTERLLHAGEWADSGDAVVRLVDSKALEVQAWVPVDALAFVGQGSELTLTANPHAAKGTVRTIVPVGSERSRLYELRIQFAANGWPAGQTLRVAVPTEKPKEVVAIPRDALVLRRDGTTVYRIDAQGTAEAVAVTTGIAEGDLIEVTGIRPGDRVVTRGGERLRPGQKVQIVGAGGGS